MRAQIQLSWQYLCMEKKIFILKEFVELIPIKNTIIGANILKASLHWLEAKNLNLSRLVSMMVLFQW